MVVRRRVHITLAASIGDPPPRAMIVSGSNALITSVPRSTVVISGSGSTSEKTWTVTRLLRFVQLVNNALNKTKFFDRFVCNNHNAFNIFTCLKVLDRIAFEVNF